MKKEVVIIGAGLVGSLLSIYLARKGYSEYMSAGAICEKKK
jgi:glycine/D-amino acid oxidase-like deaminating enzyme